MNERDIIQLFTGRNAGGESGLIYGIGDDCAVIAKDAGCSWLVTMDTLVEAVHFDLGWHPAGKLGRKAVSVNVSDIAAMGGAPRFIFLSLGLPKGFDPAWVRAFSEGVTDGCREYGCLLAGGDTVLSRGGVMITITVIGEAGADKVVYRNGARLGDDVWVSGELGSAAAGLALCGNGLVPEHPALQPLVEAHLDPRPRLGLGRMLAGSGLVHAMMDLSDGLATDLSHLCGQSGAGALIHSEWLPCSPLLGEASALLQRDKVDLMIRGGEDYELVFTAAPGSASIIQTIANQAGAVVSRVGVIDDKPGVRLVRSGSQGRRREVDVSFGGFDHFPEA